MHGLPADPHIAVLSRSFSQHPQLRQELARAYRHLRFNESGRSLQGEELLRFLSGQDAAIVALEKIDAPLLRQLPGLRVLSKYGVGLDNIDLPAAAAQGIAVGWQAGVNRRSVAELTLCFILAALRGVFLGQSEIRSSLWRQYRGRELADVTVGLIGCGHVGQEVARLLRLFGTTVLVQDPRDLAVFCAAHGVRQVSLPHLLDEADVVSLHLPAMPETAGLLNATRLGQMRAGAILVNTARGGLVDETALRRALANGQLSAACFDVFATEPPQNAGLLALPNFLATPHIGGSSEAAVLAMGRAAIAGLADAGDPLRFLPTAPLAAQPA